jgi:hypothetical protein
LCRFLFVFSFYLLVSCFLPAIETASFTPLAYNERFAYSLQSISVNGQVRQRLTLYAVYNNNLSNITELVTFEPVNRDHIQFTGDLKKCFFYEELLIRNPDLSFSRVLNLYLADGHTGTVRRLLTDVGIVRVTENGRFILFQNLYRGEFAQLFLFDVEKDAIVAEFEWVLERPLEDRQRWPHAGWYLLRFDNVFRVYEIVELDIIRAVAELDPSTMQLITLWDYLNTPEFSSIPWMGDANWHDDVMLLRQNPNIFLQR